MILHLLTDEKFTDYAIQQFSGSDMRSEFVLIPSNNMLYLVKNIEKCRIIQSNSQEFNDLLLCLGNYSGIVLHGMFWAEWEIPVLRAAPDNVKVAWVCWGGEMYSSKERGNNWAAPATKMIIRLRSFKKSKRICQSWEVPKELFQRIDYCTTSIEEEFDYAKSFYKNRMEHIWYTYYSIEETLGQLITERCNGCNVILGNSAQVANCHFDVLLALSKSKVRSKLRNSRIIAPLSYGDAWVRNLVTRIGKLMFGKRFWPLTSYLPREDYNSLILSCSTMIIGATEPMAQGNILTALWLGLRVYLSEKSITYQFFKRIGAVVFSYEKDLSRYHFTMLTDVEVNHNKDVLMKVYGKEHVMQGARNLVSVLS